MMIEGLTVHKSVTLNRVMRAVKDRSMTLDNPGFCLACGAEASGVEGDARQYECESCEEPAVYGAEEILIHMI